MSEERPVQVAPDNAYYFVLNTATSFASRPLEEIITTKLEF
jgi:hypothetical protein